MDVGQRVKETVLYFDLFSDPDDEKSFSCCQIHCSCYERPHPIRMLSSSRMGGSRDPQRLHYLHPHRGTHPTC